MSNYQTADESKQDQMDKMGDELGKLYHHIWQEFAGLYSKWNEYLDLFGTKPSRIDLLNQASSRFFRIVQDSLWENTILQISRLTDPSTTFKKGNLSIQRIPEFIENDELKKEIEHLVQDALEKAAFCKDWRNRKIAHNDLNLILKEGAKPLKSASRAKTKEVLKSISLVLNTVSQHYLESETMFDMESEPSGGAVSLLYVIDDGLKAAAERKERRQSGNYTKDDFKRRDL